MLNRLSNMTDKRTKLNDKGNLLSGQQVAEFLGLDSFRRIKPFLKTLPAVVFPPGKKRWYYEDDVRDAVEENKIN